MPILYVTEEDSIRESVKAKLKSISEKKSILSHQGDIKLDQTFDQFHDKQFDFITWTHTLEDLREQVLY